jgi:PAT family beta-lactamase induction signal transducer AmpG
MSVNNTAQIHNWKAASIAFLHPRVITMLFLGFSAGIPILLIFSSLSLWLREAGVERSAVTFFSWAALGYSFKFIWAPLVDKLPIPLLTSLLGRRRAWILMAQLSIITAIFWMASTNPAQGEHQLTLMAFAAVLLGFSSATQDIVIDAYRIEAADEDTQTLMSSTYIAGYRIGMLVAGAGALFLASYWGSETDHYSYQAWLWTYSAMAAVMLVGVMTTLIIPEPEKFRHMAIHLPAGYLAAIIALLFTANELSFSLTESSNPYYLFVIWGIRSLLLIATLSLFYHKFKRTNESSLITHGVTDNAGLSILLASGAIWLFIYIFNTFGIDILHWRTWGFILATSIIALGYYIRNQIISDPTPIKRTESAFSTQDYLRFVLLFILAVVGFIAVFYFSAETVKTLKTNLEDIPGNKHLASFIIETLRLGIGIAVALFIAKLCIRGKLVKARMLQETYIAPIQDFFQRYGIKIAWMLLLLVGLYRISDIVLGVISNVFYQDLGFTKPEIASIVKTFGLFMTIAGGFLGGMLSVRYGVMRILFLGAVLSAATNLLFMLLAGMGHNIPMLYLVISADNLSAGLASAAFIAFLSSLTNIRFTAVQYAIFSSLMTLLPKIIGGYSGSMVDSIGYPGFFLMTALMGLPVLVLILVANRHLTIKPVEFKQ